LRQFCRVYMEKVPDDTTLIRWATLIQPETLQALLAHVVALAQQLKVTKGRKLRVDGKVVETNIPYPVDSVLLSDGVRVVGRLLGKACQFIGGLLPGGKSWLRQQTQRAHQHMLRIMAVARERGEAAEGHLQSAYTDLLQLTQDVLKRATTATDRLRQGRDRLAQRLAEQLSTFLP